MRTNICSVSFTTYGRLKYLPDFKQAKKACTDGGSKFRADMQFPVCAVPVYTLSVPYKRLSGQKVIWCCLSGAYSILSVSLALSIRLISVVSFSKDVNVLFYLTKSITRTYLL